MLTRHLDAALDAIGACNRKLPTLRDDYPPGSPKRAALDRALKAIRHVEEEVFGRAPQA